MQEMTVQTKDHGIALANQEFFTGVHAGRSVQSGLKIVAETMGVYVKRGNQVLKVYWIK